MHGTPAGHRPPPEPEELTGQARALCERGAAVVRDSPPTEDVLWLAEQLADVGRLLGQAARAGAVAAAARAGAVAADAYERGRLDERAGTGDLPPAGAAPFSFRPAAGMTGGPRRALRAVRPLPA